MRYGRPIVGAGCFEFCAVAVGVGVAVTAVAAVDVALVEMADTLITVDVISVPPPPPSAAVRAPFISGADGFGIATLCCPPTPALAVGFDADADEG